MSDFRDLFRNEFKRLRHEFDMVWTACGGLLTPELAGRTVMAPHGPLELTGVEKLPLRAAAVLAHHDSDLRLPSLRDIEVELARLLGQLRHQLYLDGCTSLTAEAARALANHGLETIRRSWEESLEAWQKLDEMLSPDDEDWRPEHTAELSDAILLGSGFLEGQTVSLSGIRRLTPAAAHALGQHKGTLIVDGVTELDDEAAEGLKHHFGTLELNGLRTISLTAARALAYGGGKWPRYLLVDHTLRLNGLKTLSPGGRRRPRRVSGQPLAEQPAGTRAGRRQRTGNLQTPRQA